MYKTLTTNKSMNQIMEGNSHSSIERQFFNQLMALKQEAFRNEVTANNHLKQQEALISHSVHQLKTPLASINLIVENNQLKNPELDSIWETLLLESHKLDNSLNQVLLYTRSTHLLADLNIEELNLESIVKEVINDLRNYFIQLSIFPKFKNHDDEATIIYSDKKWLRVAIYQLLTNAIKYSDPDQSVMITISNCQLIITNIGDSIPKKDINRVFDLFYTGSKGRDKGEATGIGLYLVKEILTALEHDFILTSQNHETTVSIDF